MLFYVDSNGVPHEIGGLTEAEKTALQSAVDNAAAANTKANQVSGAVYTKAEIDALLPSLSSFALKSEVDAKGSCATKGSVENISNKLTQLESAIINLGVKTYDDDLNELTLTRRYLILNGATHAPATPCYLEVLAASSDFVLQRATMNNGSEKKRVYNGSAWSEWA